MANPSKNKGTSFESSLVSYYSQFWLDVRRNTLAGNKDIGDIGGLPVPIEAKNCKTLALPQWMTEANKEAENANKAFCPIVHKRRGITDPALQWATVENWVLVELLLAYEKDIA